ncbi:MAG: polysaccharide pyruvyl transferase family protein [Cyanobacteria bacterium J06649_11]
MKNHLKNIAKTYLTEEQLSKVKTIEKILYLPIGLWTDFRIQRLSQAFPMKPQTLNLLVNDVCNSRCQMCLIWNNKKSRELSVNELNEILKDDLFSEIEYVGVSGGEPTLRSDLPEIFRTICSKKPKVKGVGVITNGIIEDIVKSRILESAAICESLDIPFNVMFSLDGLDDVHDTVRGRKNNFRSIQSLINFFHHETNIPTSFGCTITASNALYVDELLDYAETEGLYGRFRIAEFIQRLYNDDQSEYIRAFDEKTLYHLGLFFFRLEHKFETIPMFQKTYHNIRKMLSESKKRQIACPYQSRAVVLTSKGELLYCSPKSPNLGNALLTSAKEIYFSNLEKRQKIVRNDCQDCIHDYHSPVTTYEKIAAFSERQRRKKYDCKKLVARSKFQSKSKRKVSDCSQLKSSSVLIIGWYGTETAGDKAILWSVVNKLRSRTAPPQKIYLSSLHPFVTNWTVKELNLNDVKVVETYTKEFERVSDSVDEVVVGGGPLMDIEPLNHILYAFIKAAKKGRIARIEGCGVGPLTNQLYTTVVSEIFRLSNHITLRDAVSASRGANEFNVSNVRIGSDPAVQYVEYIKATDITFDKSNRLEKRGNVSCFLREWTTEYRGDLSADEFIYLKQKFETQLVEMILALSSKANNINLLPMHTFSVGGDDRYFNRKLAKRLLSTAREKNLTQPVSFVRGPASPLEILKSMSSSRLNICMRFHSVLFAETLGVPYIAIDYTNGGKIKAFLESKAKTHKLITLKEVANNQWREKLKILSAA